MHLFAPSLSCVFLLIPPLPKSGSSWQVCHHWMPSPKRSTVTCVRSRVVLFESAASGIAMPL